MEAGVSDHVWSLDEIVRLLVAAAPAPGARGVKLTHYQAARDFASGRGPLV